MEAGRVGIVGAGVIGLCCAFSLQRDGFAVELFDPREPGTGASLGNAGIIASSEVLPLARPATLRKVPGMLFDRRGPLILRPAYIPKALPWFARFVRSASPGAVRRTSEALAGALHGSLAAWTALAQDIGIQDLIAVNGWLRLFLTRRGFTAAAADLDRQRELGIRLEILGPTEIAALEPSLANVGHAAVLFPEVGNLTAPLRVMQAVAHYAVRAGSIIHRSAVKRIERNDQHVILIDQAGDRHFYDRVVIAAGAWSRQLIRDCGMDVPLDTERGYHAMLKAPPATLIRPVTVVSPGYTLVPMQDGLRLTTGVEFAGLHAPPDFRRLRGMVDHASKVLPALATPADSEWLGFRPSTPDSMPVVGSLPDDRRVLMAFGHGHLGVTLGPVTGRAIADELCGRSLPPFASAFMPARFARH